jgi:hypothetical protein
MQLENGKPVPPRFRNANGEVLDLGFAQRASVMHTLDVKLVPGKKAIYDLFSDNDGAGIWRNAVSKPTYGRRA